MAQNSKDHVQQFNEELIVKISNLCGKDSSGVVNTLYGEGLLDNNSIRNYLIRNDFDEALKKDDADLIKHIFIDLSVKYDISIRQTQRIVYDYMRRKCQ